ncbi:hypothetical protein SAMN04488523_104143 [Sulfitobacter brevis]|uniref:Uncharacterized protein n=1 Tax=Sulfitobacter brevis TaxID=74348 RepID=A0A1I1WUD1_9RHOB|nr:hypothetical protein [Sulfitobacter brevis]SFD98649.1 hypothetical protein SAMN04488523_104143 [Sulfitobacter brevis]
MKLIIATTAAALLSTAAFADESTRYNDLRLDTSKSAIELSGDHRETLIGEDQSTRAADLRLDTSDDSGVDASLSTRGSIQSPGEGYIYGGYGPGNDSR